MNISEHKPISTKFYSMTLEEKKMNKFKNYNTYESIINELLEKRNDIAHGNPKIFQDKFLTQEKINVISDGIQLVLRQLKEDLVNILENDEYLL